MDLVMKRKLTEQEAIQMDFDQWWRISGRASLKGYEQKSMEQKYKDCALMAWKAAFDLNTMPF